MPPDAANRQVGLKPTGRSRQRDQAEVVQAAAVALAASAAGPAGSACTQAPGASSSHLGISPCAAGSDVPAASRAAVTALSRVVKEEGVDQSQPCPGFVVHAAAQS